jgi:hypothetical protein
MTDPLEEILTLEDAADLLGITHNAMLKAARRGTLRARRFGAPTRGLWITTHDEVDRYRALVRRPRPWQLTPPGPFARAMMDALSRPAAIDLSASVIRVQLTSSDGSLNATFEPRPPGEHEDGDLELEIRPDGTAIVR